MVSHTNEKLCFKLNHSRRLVLAPQKTRNVDLLYSIWCQDTSRLNVILILFYITRINTWHRNRFRNTRDRQSRSINAQAPVQQWTFFFFSEFEGRRHWLCAGSKIKFQHWKTKPEKLYKYIYINIKVYRLPRYRSPLNSDVITSVGAMTKVGRQADRDTRLKLNSRQTGRQADSLAQLSIHYYISILFIFLLFFYMIILQSRIIYLLHFRSF